MRFYAGIGARITPYDVLCEMEKRATILYREGWWLRSGGAPGADTAFELGAFDYKQIFRPEDATPEAIELTARFHPKWSACTQDARLKHGRNAMIVLGADLETPVEKVVCWTFRGRVKGGTGQALRIAEAYGIPIENLGEVDVTRDLFR